MNHLKNTPLPNLAAQYSILRERVIGHQLNTFRAIQQQIIGPPLSEIPLGVPGNISKGSASIGRIPYANMENEEMYLLD